MIFRLALAMGRPDPYAMLDEMPPGVLAQWEAFECVEPFGFEWTTALIACEVRRVGVLLRMIAGDKDAKFPMLQDFLPVAADGAGSHSHRLAADGGDDDEARTKRIEREQAIVKAAFGIKG